MKEEDMPNNLKENEIGQEFLEPQKEQLEKDENSKLCKKCGLEFGSNDVLKIHDMMTHSENIEYRRINTNISLKNKKLLTSSNPNQPFGKVTAINASPENLVSTEPEISYQKIEMLSAENKYTGDTVHEEKKKEIITLKVQEDDHETKMRLNCLNQ